jgi:hypothetical protein
MPTLPHYLCIILIDDPTNNIGNPDVEWQYDSQVFIQNKEVWKKYMNTDRDILCLFRNTDKNLKEGQHILDISTNTLTVQGYHKYGALINPLNSIKVLDSYYTYDFLITTTSSSFLVLPKLKIRLLLTPKQNIYMGYFYIHYDVYKGPMPFIVGSCICFSKNVAKLLTTGNILEHQFAYEYNDDLAISIYLKHYGIEPQNANWHYAFENNNISDVDERIKQTDLDNIIHYRVKNTDERLLIDTLILNKLYNYYYVDKFKKSLISEQTLSTSSTDIP